jgi:hypothetical protein
MSADLPADRPGRGIQPGDQVHVFAAVDIADTHIHDTGREFLRRRHVAVYCARSGRRDPLWFGRSSMYSDTSRAAVAFLRHTLTVL